MLDHTTLLFGRLASMIYLGDSGGGTHESGYLDSTSAGTPESWGQSPRSPPGVPAFSGG